MYEELSNCVEELRENHTDKEIACALAEYAQIVENVSRDYTDTATVADLRADHPELGMRRMFHRNGWYYANYLNAIFQIPSIHDLGIQGGPKRAGWMHFMMEDRPFGICVITKMP